MYLQGKFNLSTIKKDKGIQWHMPIDSLKVS